jgi:hypothetical protein
VSQAGRGRADRVRGRSQKRRVVRGAALDSGRRMLYGTLTARTR